MITETILNKFKNNILNEDLPLPHGTKSAKIVCHVDLDGLISGISMVQQLQRQGIPKNRIKVEFAQYGDEDKEHHKHTEKFVGRKGEFVGVTDFAKLPKAKPYEIFNRLTDFKGDKLKFINFMKLKDFSKMSQEEFNNYFKSKFTIKENQWTEKSLRDLYEVLQSYSILKKNPGFLVAKSFQIFNKLANGKIDRNSFFNFLRSNNFKNSTLNEFSTKLRSSFPNLNNDPNNMNKLFSAVKDYYNTAENLRLNPNTVEKLNIQIVNPDFVSDHHSNEQGSLSGGKSGEIAVSSPSESEFFADKYAPGLWSKDDLKAVSMVDSAGYNVDQLTNTIFLDKHFTGPDKKKNLATIISCIYDNMAKKDREAAKWVIKNAQPSLVSAYTTAMKAAGYSGKRLEYVEALKKGEVDKAKELLKEIPDILNKGYDRHDEPKAKIMNREDWAKKNRKDLEDIRTGYLTPEEKAEKDGIKLKELPKEKKAAAKARKEELSLKKGKIYVKDNFTIFDGTSTRNQYSRYATSLYSVNGMRSPFTLRYWSGFFQVAKNTLYKGTVNFAAVNEKVLQDIEVYLKKNGISNFNVERIIDNMKEKNGGHSGGIWSFQGFDKIKPTSKEMGNYWMANRIAKRNPNAPTASRIKKEKEEGVIADYKKIREGCMKMAMDSAIKWTNKLCPIDKTKIDGLKNTDERFEGKN